MQMVVHRKGGVGAAGCGGRPVPRVHVHCLPWMALQVVADVAALAMEPCVAPAPAAPDAAALVLVQAIAM